MFTLITLDGHSQTQNAVIQQNQQNVNINLPVIEKPVYVERYRTIYINKPRVARRLEEPVQLLGYLWVYPEDLGDFKQVPKSVIENINARTPYGRNDWRIPTPDELAVLEANAEAIGLGDNIYLATDHRNGVLRLVSTSSGTSQKRENEDNTEDYIPFLGVKWATKNVGASNPLKEGYMCEYEDIQEFTPPAGWRLPTISEMKMLGSVEEWKTLPQRMENCSYYGGYEYHILCDNGLKKTLWFPLNTSNGGYYWCKTANGFCRVLIHHSYNYIDKYDAREDASIRLVRDY